MEFLGAMKDRNGHAVSEAEIEKYMETLGKNKKATPLDVIRGLNIKINGLDAEVANTYDNMWDMLKKLNKKGKVKFMGYKRILTGGELEEFYLPEYTSV